MRFVKKETRRFAERKENKEKNIYRISRLLIFSYIQHPYIKRFLNKYNFNTLYLDTFTIKAPPNFI